MYMLLFAHRSSWFKHQVLIACFLALLVNISITSITNAQDQPISWRQNLDCDPDLQIYQGIEYCTGQIPSGDGITRTVHVIVVDLHSQGVKIEYVIAEGLDEDDRFGECRDVNRSTKPLDLPRGPGCDDPNDRSGDVTGRGCNSR
jgi:hypothetical protein